jgi:hypothetical protein
VTVTFTVPLSIVTSVSLDTLDLDSFLVPVRGAAEACRCLRCLGAASGACRCRPLGRAQGPRWPGSLYNKETIQGVDVDIALQGKHASG